MADMLVVQAEQGSFWCGYNRWDEQLRKAQIFVSEKFANDIVKRYKELNPKVVPVYLSLEKPTIAPAPQWIPVTERLPEADGEYLCYFEDGGCWGVHFDETEQAFGDWINEFAPDTLGWCGEHFEDYQGITHWMPLPKPPEMDGGADHD